jgi:hypothetical protein
MSIELTKVQAGTSDSVDSTAEHIDPSFSVYVMILDHHLTRLAGRLIDHFGPTGRILDPCRGDGALYDNALLVRYPGRERLPRMERAV